MWRNMGLLVDYLPLTKRNSAAWDDVLGVVTFGDPPVNLDRTDIPVAAVNTPMLGAGAAICEVWRTQRPVESGQWARVRYRRDDNVLFGCISVVESAASACVEDGSLSALQAATENAYREIFSVLDLVGYGHLLRVWNYLPEINGDSLGTERYWQFNKARRDALIACGQEVTGNFPAACALGSESGSPLVIYFLASKTAPIAVENPRQISAYRYPQKYGPRPMFARASVLETLRRKLTNRSSTSKPCSTQPTASSGLRVLPSDRWRTKSTCGIPPICRSSRRRLLPRSAHLCGSCT